MKGSTWRQMHLVLVYNPTGRILASWRRKTSPVTEFYGLELPKRVARKAEAACFDAIFLADSFQVGSTGPNPKSSAIEPFTTLSALAAVTTRIGLIGTGSTSYVEPYHMTRYCSSLDHLNQGRIGWNVVTSMGGEEHFSVDLPQHDERYVRAYEYFEVVKALIPYGAG